CFSMSCFFNDTATTEIYTLSLHDALPIWLDLASALRQGSAAAPHPGPVEPDRKSTRLNSSHANISYAVFCLNKKTSREYGFIQTLLFYFVYMIWQFIWWI